MFPKVIGGTRVGIGTLTGTLGVAEASSGNIFLLDSTVITNSDIADAVEWEVDTGGGYVPVTLSALLATAYVASVGVRKRLFNPYFNVATAYITQVATALDTGGSTVLQNLFNNTLGAPTVSSVSQPSNGVARAVVVGSVAQDSYDFLVSFQVNMDQLASPFTTYSDSTTLGGNMSTSPVNVDWSFTISGPAGAYSGDIVANANLAYAYPDGPVITGAPQGTNSIVGTSYTKP